MIHRRQHDLFDESVQEMSRMIAVLSNKNKPKPAESDEPEKPVHYIKKQDLKKQISKEGSDAIEPQSPNQIALPEHVPDKRSPSPTHTPLIQSTPPLEQPPLELPPLEQPPLEHTTSPLLLSNSPAPTSKPPSVESTSREEDQSVLVERPATPLETTLLNTLQSKDLGSTGFVTAKELETTLLQLPQGNAVCLHCVPNYIELILTTSSKQKYNC